MQYPFALAASLIENERARARFIASAARNRVNPYMVIRKATSKKTRKAH